MERVVAIKEGGFAPPESISAKALHAGVAFPACTSLRQWAAHRLR